MLSPCFYPAQELFRWLRPVQPVAAVRLQEVDFQVGGLWMPLQLNLVVQFGPQLHLPMCLYLMK